MSSQNNPIRLAASFFWVLGAVVAVLAMLASLAVMRPPSRHLWGDEGTFVAMTASLVRDGDLAFDEPDLQWVLTRQPGPPVTVILQQTERGITYSKPVLYPLLSAPLYAVGGESGLVVLNLAALVLALVLAWRFLRSQGPSRAALWTLATFVCCSVLLGYIGWQMSDLLQAALTLVGLVLVLGGRRPTTPFASQRAAILGALLLGATVSMRFTAAALVVAAIVAILLDGRLKRAALVAVVAGLTFVAASETTRTLLGTTNPYKAQRSSFNQSTGYPAGAESAVARERFTTRPATQSATWRPRFDARRTAYSTLYFFVGRHTGLLFYFPVALVLLIHILRHPERQSLALLAGVAATVVFYLVWMPENYYGGSTFLGNRYFLGVFPALLVASSRLPTTRSLNVAWMLALYAWGSAVASVAAVRDVDPTSQSHTHAGVFRLLPYESTARRIDGLVDRFWADDFVRFLDPFSRPAPWSFRLHSDRPATEIMVATDWPGERLLFAVSPKPAKAILAVSDSRRETRFTLPQEPPAPRGLIEIPTSPAWRRHSFWWRAGRLYRARVLRFDLQSMNGEPVVAEVRYVGRGRLLAALSAELAAPDLPLTVMAGDTTPLLLRLRNTGRRPWLSQSTLPIRLGYRILRPESGEVVGRGRQALPTKVRPNETIEIALEIRWPREPHDYEVRLELQRQQASLLGEHGRLLLASAGVRVQEAVNPDSPEP